MPKLEEMSGNEQAYQSDFEDYNMTVDILKGTNVMTEIMYAPPQEVQRLTPHGERNFLDRVYRFTRLGTRFVAACRPPKKDS